MSRRKTFRYTAGVSTLTSNDDFSDITARYGCLHEMKSCFGLFLPVHLLVSSFQLRSLMSFSVCEKTRPASITGIDEPGAVQFRWIRLFGTISQWFWFSIPTPTYSSISCCKFGWKVTLVCLVCFCNFFTGLQISVI